MSALNFIIGIQARTTSTRLPNKVLLPIKGKSILQRIVNTCKSSADNINKTFPKSKEDNRRDSAHVDVVVICPFNDSLKNHIRGVDIIEGPENDVLGRYIIAANKYNPDFIVRITADCLSIPDYVISRHIKRAIIRKYHYITNTIERTEREGFDCEVLSRKLLDYLDKNAKSPHHREHVTSYIYEAAKLNIRPFPFPDFPFDICSVIDKMDLSFIKTSIDTLEEYNNAVNNVKKLDEIKERCQKIGVYHI